MKHELRDYQQEALSSLIQGFKDSTKQLCVLPTGSGKTFIFSHLIEHLKLNTLVIAHTQELLSQSKKSIDSICTNTKSEIYHYQARLNSNVILCSIQSTSHPKTIERLKKCDFDLLIIDECHRSAALGYRKLITSLGFENKKMVGFTATPFRTDEQCVYEIFGNPSVEVSILDMIDQGYLVDFEGYRIKTGISLKGVESKSGDFNSSKLSPVINVKNRNQLIVEQYLEIAKDEKALCFCVNVEHSYAIKSMFNHYGVSCECLEGTMDKNKRKKIISQFKSGEIKVLTNCNILTEGFDEPSISTILMARPTRSKTLYMQMIGRGCRLYPGKNKCKLIEFTDNTFDICGIEDLTSQPDSDLEILPGESLKSFREREIKYLQDVGTNIVVEKEQLFKKIRRSEDLVLGDKIKDFTIIEIFVAPENGEQYFKLKHDGCDSTYTAAFKTRNKIQACMFCTHGLKNKHERLQFLRTDRYLNKTTLYAKCDCGNEKTYTSNYGPISVKTLLENSKSCGCLRNELNYLKTDNKIGTFIGDAKVLEKISNTEFKCQCIKCGFIFTKTNRQLVNSRCACSNCNIRAIRNL